MKQLPDLETLNERLICDPIAGKLYWRAREGDDRATNVWNGKYAGKEAGTPKDNGYVKITIDDQSYIRHRIIWAMYHQTLTVPELDHVHGVEAGDGIANLQVLSHRENIRKARIAKNNTTGVKGVVKAHGKFQARIKVDGKVHYDGGHETIEAAALARQKLEAKHWRGEKA